MMPSPNYRTAHQNSDFRRQWAGSLTGGAQERRSVQDGATRMTPPASVATPTGATANAAPLPPRPAAAPPPARAAADPAPPPNERMNWNVERPTNAQGAGAKSLRRLMMQYRAQLASSQLPGLYDLIEQMKSRTDPENIASGYANRFEGLSDQQARGDSQLLGHLSGAGMMDSSRADALMAQKASYDAAARSGMQNQVFQQAEGNQDELRRFLAGLFEGNASGVTSTAGDIVGEQMAREQMDAQKFAALMQMFGGLGAGLGTAAGGYLGRPTTVK
jgi:hypothetical protein